MLFFYVVSLINQIYEDNNAASFLEILEMILS